MKINVVIVLPGVNVSRVFDGSTWGREGVSEAYSGSGLRIRAPVYSQSIASANGYVYTRVPRRVALYAL